MRRPVAKSRALLASISRVMLGLMWVIVLASPSEAQAPDGVQATAATQFPNCRLGAAILHDATAYDLAGLNLGWYVSYSTQSSPPKPHGMEFVQVVRVHQKKTSWCRDCYELPYDYNMTPSAATLAAQVTANPGATWFIGNEPDRRDWSATGGQDEIVPELYAQAYHDIWAIIRGVDPTARIGPGGVVQGTPLRLKYLDRVWTQYQALFGHRWGDDVDVWNLHSFILNEKKGDYGADIPAGLTDSKGVTMSCEDNASMTYFRQFVVAFRTWLRDKGERNKPLYITEYGINMPDYCVTSAQLKAFMNASFDYLLNTTNSSLGYPLDGNRLVQRFMWYSLDDSADSPDRVEEYADSLFSSVTHLRQDYGDNWYNYVHSALATHQEANTPRINLLLEDSRTVPASYYRPTDPVTFTLRAMIYNNGNTRTDSAAGITLNFWSGTPSGAHTLIGTQVITNLCGCALGTMVEQPWRIDLPATGSYPWYVEAVALPGETNTVDNTEAGLGIIASVKYHLPIILKMATS